MPDPQTTKRCPEHDLPMMELKFAVPEESVAFTIFGFEIVIRRWRSHWECMGCVQDDTDRRGEPCRDAYWAGKEDGYLEGLHAKR